MSSPFVEKLKTPTSVSQGVLMLLAIVGAICYASGEGDESWYIIFCSNMAVFFVILATLFEKNDFYLLGATLLWLCIPTATVSANSARIIIANGLNTPVTSDFQLAQWRLAGCILLLLAMWGIFVTVTEIQRIKDSFETALGRLVVAIWAFHLLGCVLHWAWLGQSAVNSSTSSVLLMDMQTFFASFVFVAATMHCMEWELAPGLSLVLSNIEQFTLLQQALNDVHGDQTGGLRPAGSFICWIANVLMIVVVFCARNVQSSQTAQTVLEENQQQQQLLSDEHHQSPISV
eukprot:gnl/Spiro4/28191_TR13945_c0_g2_i1.p1 gnl/Spiro4/28191_TR13945_c0_g2~~gnl/Spiro4/28191_TR13945_c0_g2_i1.p1  ORF type:complete len:311 (-),score=47.35 gnl/Spiro4/28191_TR13945_c0_g2_i1:54-920(-)